MNLLISFFPERIFLPEYILNTFVFIATEARWISPRSMDALLLDTIFSASSFFELYGDRTHYSLSLIHISEPTRPY